MGNRHLRRSNSQLKFALVGLVLAVVVGALYFSGGGQQSLAVQQVSPVESLSPTGEKICSAGFGSSVVRFSGFDIDNKGTATAELKTVWTKNEDNSWKSHGTVADAGTLTLATGISGRALFGNNTEAVGGFYPTLVNFDVDCDKEAQIVVGYQKDKNSTAIALTRFDSAGQVQNASQNAVTVDVNGEATMKIQLKGSSRDYYGDGAMAVVFDGNSNAFDEIRLEGGSKISTPGVHSGLASARSYAWEIPELKGTALYEYPVTFDAGATEPTNVHNVTMSIYDKSWFINAETGEPAQGYNDEQNNNVGSSNDAFTLYVN